MKNIKSITTIFATIFILTTIFSCTSERKLERRKVEPSLIVKNTTEIKIDTINFYFENSGSMNGYLNGKNFKQTMHRIIDDSNLKMRPYFVNSREYSTSNLLSKIDTKNIKTTGVNSSDHKFIFSNAIKNATGNNLSIVVTDGIYSTPNGDVKIVEIDIEKAFERALRKNEIETVVLKLSSHYKGWYYTESDCAKIEIDQDRPYYILLFGSKEAIDNALKNIVVIDKLPGFKKQARFFLTDNLKVEYTILTQGEEKKGTFRKIGKGGKGLVKSIEDAEKSNRGGKFFQFGIAVDYSNLSLPNSYLKDINNYHIDEESGYQIESIINVSDVSKSSKTYNVISKIMTNEDVSLTNIIVVKSSTKIVGELEIELINNLPSWIKNSGVEDDCDIKDNTSQTFAFDKLMNGIANAYEEVNDSDEYLELKLNIKH